jgi:hypothetical protein
MILVDKNGSEKKRVMLRSSKDFGKLTKSHIKFIYPEDVNGTTFLSWENENADDTQYLYLPELGRARRIVSNQRNSAFVNSDFTYEDMQRRKTDDCSHELAGSKNINGADCYVVKSTYQKNINSQYTYVVHYVRKDNFVIIKVEYYDKQNRNCKVLEITSLKNISNIWTPMGLSMVNLREKHKTIITQLEVKYDQNISDTLFNLRNLEKQ